MATNATWTVIFNDKRIIKRTTENEFYEIDDNSFWSNSDYSNIWAIQYGTSVSTDEVEYRDETPHSTWASTGLNFQTFIDKWDAAHLVFLQNEWDNTQGNISTGVLYANEAEKISNLGTRPTSYSS
tara:strand:+ start:615 stop:992 length:378 start_codon:yes stop_codon:yes gene_type:complete